MFRGVDDFRRHLEGSRPTKTRTSKTYPDGKLEGLGTDALLDEYENLLQKDDWSYSDAIDQLRGEIKRRMG